MIPSKHPILVERFTRKQALTLACRCCGTTVMADDAESFIATVDYGGSSCVACGSLRFIPAYEEAVRCNACRRLGHWPKTLGYCCSRICELQAEYAQQLGVDDGQ